MTKSSSNLWLLESLRNSPIAARVVSPAKISAEMFVPHHVCPCLLPRLPALVVCCLVALFASCQPTSVAGTPAANNGETSEGKSVRPYETVSLRGQVMWTADALERQFGITPVNEARQRSLCLVTEGGELYHLFEDKRGRAFRKDPRLRETDVQLEVRRYPTAGIIRIVRVYFVKPKGRYQVDYWCDVCAISMIEAGPCDCCQDDNRLRQRLVRDVVAD